MTLEWALLAVAALVIVTTAAGVLWLVSTRRQRRGSGASLDGLLGGASLGSRATVVLLTTPTCARCPAVRRTIATEIADRDDVGSAEIDVADRLDLARRLSVFRTPTTLVLDGAGRIRSRADGGLTAAALRAELDALPA